MNIFGSWSASRSLSRRFGYYFFLFRFNTYNTIFIFSMKCKKWNWLLSVSFADLLSGNNAKKGSFKRFHETTGLHNKLHHNKRSDSFFRVALGLTKPLIKFNLQRVSLIVSFIWFLLSATDYKYFFLLPHSAWLDNYTINLDMCEIFLLHFWSMRSSGEKRLNYYYYLFVL